MKCGKNYFIMLFFQVNNSSLSAEGVTPVAIEKEEIEHSLMKGLLWSAHYLL